MQKHENCKTNTQDLHIGEVGSANSDGFKVSYTLNVLFE